MGNHNEETRFNEGLFSNFCETNRIFMEGALFQCKKSYNLTRMEDADNSLMDSRRLWAPVDSDGGGARQILTSVEHGDGVRTR